MCVVTIANFRLYGTEGGENFDISTEEGVNDIYSFAEQVDQQGDLYIITNIDTPWANHYECTLLDDIVAVVESIKDFTPKEYNVFEAIAKKQMHDVLDVVIRIEQGQILEYHADIDEDDIWESVTMNNKKIVVTR